MFDYVDQNIPTKCAIPIFVLPTGQNKFLKKWKTFYPSKGLFKLYAPMSKHARVARLVWML